MASLLRDNFISTAGLTPLVQTLSGHPTLRSLDLRDNDTVFNTEVLPQPQRCAAQLDEMPPQLGRGHISFLKRAGLCFTPPKNIILQGYVI